MEQTATAGTIQVSRDTDRLIAPLFDFEALAAIEVRGKAAPVNHFRVIGAKAAPGSLQGIQGLDSPPIGRDADMEPLRQTVDQFMMGNGTIRHRFSWILWQSPLQPQFQRQWRSKRPHPSTSPALLQMQPRPTNPYSCFNVAIGDIVHSVRQFVR
ncbi:MAG TPA: hypothetical protein EYN37_06315 [Dehalococcoidia bacterium]|nr:hypothetical protein [Dehalococcoidia bacterium]